MSELPQCFTSAFPKARKVHKCCECRGEIRIGENYHRFSGVWCGEPARYKVCVDCEKLRTELDVDFSDPEDAIAYTSLSQHVSDTEETRERFVAIMKKRNAKIHETWLRPWGGISK